MSDIVEAVAKAIETALVSGSASAGDERLREIARAAIEAYEVEQRKLQTHRATLQSAYNDAYIRGGFLDRVGKP